MVSLVNRENALALMLMLQHTHAYLEQSFYIGISSQGYSLRTKQQAVRTAFSWIVNRLRSILMHLSVMVEAKRSRTQRLTREVSEGAGGQFSRKMMNLRMRERLRVLAYSILVEKQLASGRRSSHLVYVKGQLLTAAMREAMKYSLLFLDMFTSQKQSGSNKPICFLVMCESTKMIKLLLFARSRVLKSSLIDDWQSEAAKVLQLSTTIMSYTFQLFPLVSSLISSCFYMIKHLILSSMPCLRWSYNPINFLSTLFSILSSKDRNISRCTTLSLYFSFIFLRTSKSTVFLAV